MTRLNIRTEEMILEFGSVAVVSPQSFDGPRIKRGAPGGFGRHGDNRTWCLVCGMPTMASTSGIQVG